MEIEKRTRWDGSSKTYTLDCNNCEWYRRIGRRELCGWGIAFKYLIRTNNSRRCEIKNRGAPENQSIKYLDKLLENAMD